MNYNLILVDAVAAAIFLVIVPIILHFSSKYLIKRISPGILSYPSYLLFKIKNYVIAIITFIFISLIFYPLYHGSKYENYYLILSNIIIILLSSMIVLQGIKMFSNYLTRKFTIATISAEKRAAITKFRFIENILKMILIIITAALILTNFESVKDFGISLLASAGFLTAILIFASQKFIANFFAGVQVAFTNSIKLDDVVIIENEFGRIEKITLTYIVVRLWDNRSIIMPVTYFVDNPFQNWTYNTSELVGSVFLYLDYQCNLDLLRKEFSALLTDNPLWDKKTKALQLTDCKEHVIEIRLLVSAANSKDLFDLRCYVREKMLNYIANKNPCSLPKARLYFGKPVIQEKEHANPIGYS